MTSTATIDKVVRLGTREDVGSIFAHIKFSDGKLSITGVEGPKANGDCRGGCGQIVMSGLSVDAYAPGWHAQKVAKLAEIWDRWHLNDMRAGTPAQEREIERRTAAAKAEYGVDGPALAYKLGFDSHYSMACAWLNEAGLYDDNGYKYGHAWLREEVPADVVAWLDSLPETDLTPAWI